MTMKTVVQWSGAFAFAVAAACAPVPTPPRPVDLPDVLSASAPLGDVWPRALSYIADQGFPIETSDRQGGLVRTGWLKLAPDHNGWLTCGANAIGDQLRIRGDHVGWARVQVVMTDAGGSTALRVRPDFQIWYGVTSPLDPRGSGPLAVCQTTGTMEQALLEATAK